MRKKEAEMALFPTLFFIKKYFARNIISFVVRCLSMDSWKNA